MPLIKGCDGSGKEMTFVEEEGNVYPQSLVEFSMQNDLKKKLHDVTDFVTREDDVFICAYMKSGTHWLWEIVSMLLNKTTDYMKQAKEVTMMEFNTQEELDIVPSPRILNHHFPVRYVPKQAIQKRRPILHIMRNPKDICVSYYNHWQTLPDYENVDNFSVFLPFFTGENGFYLIYSWCKYELEWEKFTKAHPEYPLLNIYYEDLKQDTKTSIRRIAKFLEADVTDEVIDTIADKCEIKKMRKAAVEVKDDILKNFLIDGNPFMYRKGTHWLWEIVSMLLNKTTDYMKQAKEVTMMEFNTQEELDIVPSPRILNHHFPVRYVPKQAIQKRRPILHIMRNPKDICVSYYNHWQTLPDYENVDNFSVFLPFFTGENGFYLIYSWCKYELEWEKFTKAHPEYPLLNIYYEDLKQDTKTSIRRIAKFLEADVTDEVIDTIADKCEIKKMRKAAVEVKDDILKNFLIDGNPFMYRKGEVGDWKNWFTVAENEKFDDWLSNNLVATDLNFKYSM